MFNIDVTLQVLKSLIRVHNNRIKVYKSFLQKLKQLSETFKNILINAVSNSEDCIRQLNEEITTLEVEPDKNFFSQNGEIPRSWVTAIKNIFGGKNIKQVLSTCEKIEDALQEAYDTAALSYDKLSPDLLQLILDQQLKLKADNHQIKNYRITYNAFSK